MKTEEEVYNEIQTYINSKKFNRPCTLASIKKELRTPRIIDLVFSHPFVFQLTNEFKHVPLEYRYEKFLLQFILDDPTRISLLADGEQTLPVLIAFELAKRKYERFSAIECGGQWGDKIPYTGKTMTYRDDITAHCNRLSNMVKGQDIDRIEQNQLINIIQKYCNSNQVELKPNENYVRKYIEVDLNISKRLVILVSGMPDSGKTTFSRRLSYVIKNSIYFESDDSIERNIACMPFSSLVKDTDKVIIYSDLYAFNSSLKDKVGEANVINIVINPRSIEEMYRHSKEMQHIPFEDYKAYEISKYNYDRVKNPIVVENDYTEKIYKEIDRVIEEIIRILDLPQGTVDQSGYVKRMINPNNSNEN